MAFMDEVATRQRQLELIIATFIFFHCDSEDTGKLSVAVIIVNFLPSIVRKALDNHVSLMSKALTPDDYSYALSLISDSFSSGSLEKKKIEAAVHLSNLFLRAHPQCEFYPTRSEFILTDSCQILSNTCRPSQPRLWTFSPALRFSRLVIYRSGYWLWNLWYNTVPNG
jgi:hypothetical protein